MPIEIDDLQDPSDCSYDDRNRKDRKCGVQPSRQPFAHSCNTTAEMASAPEKRDQLLAASNWPRNQAKKSDGRLEADRAGGWKEERENAASARIREIDVPVSRDRGEPVVRAGSWLQRESADHAL